MNNSSEKPINLILVSVNTILGKTLRYIEVLFNTHNLREIILRGMNEALGKLINIAESIKIIKPGLYQNTKINTIVYNVKDKKGKIKTSLVYHQLEIVLSLDEPKVKGIGYVEKLDETVRLKLYEVMRIESEKNRKRDEDISCLKAGINGRIGCQPGRSKM